MRVMLIGSGGREHALGWKLAQSPQVESIFSAPGNPGLLGLEKNQNVPIAANDLDALVKFASSEGMDLTVVGPEQPLADGLVDRFQERGLTVFGPSKYAAQIEASKKFSKELMAECKVPTAAYETFTSPSEARSYLASAQYPLVLKADGLAAGKGVKICPDQPSAEEFVQEVMEKNKFGAAGSVVVAEEYLEGQEASYFVVAHGTDYVSLVSAQDHKRLGEGDTGPNTGGMGCYSPAPIFDQEMEKMTNESIVKPILQTMVNRGHPYCGVLYVGLMITPQGPKVLEFNVRFGDPEAQVLLPRMESDLADLLYAAARGRVAHAQATWKSEHALTVVLASEGYPYAPKKGAKIEGTVEAEKAGGMVFHAGTKLQGSSLVAAGGRVLAVTGLGTTLQDAKNQAYATVEEISFPGKVYRKDIGWRAL